MDSAFQLWKDYFQLAKVVEGLHDGSPGGGDEVDPRQHPPEGPRAMELLPPPPPPSWLPDPSAGDRRPEESICTFCKQNGESRHIYASHQLKDEAGRVQCPILRNYKCPQCGASKDAAHTRRFCPLTQKGYMSVYNSCIRNSAGRKRKV